MKRIKGILHAMSESIHDTCYIWWLEMKNTFKDEGVLIFFILVPLGYPILYSWIYNNERVHDVPVAVVDNSHSQLSRELLRRVDASPDVRVAYYCNNLQEAHDLIGKEAANGVLYIPSDFEQKIGRGEQSHLSVYCDMSMMLTYKAIYQTAQTVATEINSEIQKPKSMSTTERDEEINTEPLVCDAVQIFNPTGGYGNFLLPGVLVLILQQTLLLGIGLSAGTARENNRYRDLVPVSRHYNGIFRIVCGKSMCYFMIYMVLACYVLLGVPRMFHLTQLLHFSDYLAVHRPLPARHDLLWHDHLVCGPLQGEHHATGGLHLRSLPLPQWRQLAQGGHSWRMADDRLAHSLHLRHTRLRPHERDGGNHPGHPGGV